MDALSQCLCERRKAVGCDAQIVTHSLMVRAISALISLHKIGKIISKTSILCGFLTEDMMYCQMCGRCQNEVILKRERKLKAEAQSVHAKLLAKNKQLISEGMMNAKLLMEKQAEIDKLLALINENKTEETSGNAGLGTVNDLDVDDVDLSGIDDVNLGGSQSSALNSGVESDADAAPSGSGVNNG